MTVIFIGAMDEQVQWAGGFDPRLHLVEYGSYEVARTEVHTWHTRIYLKDYPNMWFNSVCFIEVLDEGSGR